MDAGWMMWRRWPETFRIVMESSQSGLSLPHIVATSRVDVQRGVAHAAMWRKTRHPCTMRGYDYCGLQASAAHTARGRHDHAAHRRETMRYTLFGQHTGLRVSTLVLGTGIFGTKWRPGP